MFLVLRYSRAFGIACSAGFKVSFQRFVDRLSAAAASEVYLDPTTSLLNSTRRVLSMVNLKIKPVRSNSVFCCMVELHKQVS